MSKSNTKTAEVETQVQTSTVTTPVVGIVLTQDQQDAFDKMTNKSSRIRFLSSLGYKNGPIAKFLTKVYYPNGEKTVLFQHVRNVLNQPLKTAAAS
jgi:hypothetical protein